MDNWCTVEEILDFAIGEEERAQAFYLDLAGMGDDAMRSVFEGFAKEEEGHKKLLLQVKEGKRVVLSSEVVRDLKIADYMAEMDPTPNMTYEDALVVAMQREKAAFKLYTGLARLVKEEDVRELLLGIAQEEAKHKLRFEIEYDDLSESPRHGKDPFSGSSPDLSDGDVI